MKRGAPRADGPAPGGELSAEDFERFRDYFYRTTGIYFDDRKRSWVGRCLRQRMEAQGLPWFGDYFRVLRLADGGSELNHLVSCLTVNETYFYREVYQLRCLVESILPELRAEKPASEPVRIWSIPCSTGEEPYSIAIHLLEEWAEVDDVQVEIYASDIDRAALEQAKTGEYTGYTLRNLAPRLLRRYFQASGSEGYQLCRPLREAVELRPGNLVDPAVLEDLPPFDVIFCRNLLIYFDDRSRRLAAQNLFDALRPGGFVLLGHAESMSRISSLFRVRHFPQAFAYQKPLETS